jgi:hypothetical protein
MILTCCIALRLIVFFLDNHRYTQMKPHGTNNLAILSILGKSVCGLRGLNRQKVSKGGNYSDALVQSVKQLATVVPVALLI